MLYFLNFLGLNLNCKKLQLPKLIRPKHCYVCWSSDTLNTNCKAQSFKPLYWEMSGVF